MRRFFIQAQAALAAGNANIDQFANELAALWKANDGRFSADVFLSDFALDLNGIAILAKALAKHTGEQSLVLHNVELDDARMGELLKQLLDLKDQGKSLQGFIFSANELTDASIARISKLKAAHLDLSHNHLSRATAIKLCGIEKGRLDLSHNKLGTFFVEFLVNCIKLETFRLSYLDLAGNLFTDSEKKRIVEALKEAKKRDYSFSCRVVLEENEQAQAIIDRELRESQDSKYVGTSTAPTVEIAIQSLIRDTSTQLEELEDAEQIEAVLQKACLTWAHIANKNPALKSLQLYPDIYGRRGLQLVCAYLRTASVIEEFNFSVVWRGQGLSSEELQSVLEAVAQNTFVRKLNLSGQTLSKKVVEFIGQNPSAEVLDLSRTGIKSGGIKAICDVLPLNSHLRVLHLGTGDYTSEDCEMIINAVDTNIFLTQVWCDHLTTKQSERLNELFTRNWKMRVLSVLEKINLIRGILARHPELTPEQKEILLKESTAPSIQELVVDAIDQENAKRNRALAEKLYRDAKKAEQSRSPAYAAIGSSGDEADNVEEAAAVEAESELTSFIYREELTVDYDDTLNKHHEGFGIDPRLLAIIEKFSSFTIVTHRSFQESADAASKGFSSIFDQMDMGMISVSEEESDPELALFGKIFLPIFIEQFREEHPSIQMRPVCYGNTPREGFGKYFTSALLAFEYTLHQKIASLYSRIKSSIPDFNKNIIFLINYIRSETGKIFASESERFLAAYDKTKDFESFDKVADAFIRSRLNQIRDLSVELLCGFSSSRMMRASPMAKRVETPDFYSRANAEDVAMLVRLYLKQGLVTVFEKSLKDGYAEANRLKQRQFAYVMTQENCQQIYHIDDNREIATTLQMEGVRLFHYQPNCTENGEFIDDARLHRWFREFCDILKARNPKEASHFFIMHSEAGYGCEETFKKINEGLEFDEPQRNMALYALFIQCVMRFQKKLGLEAPEVEEDQLEKDKFMRLFYYDVLALSGKEDTTLIEFFDKICGFHRTGMMQILEQRFGNMIDWRVYNYNLESCLWRDLNRFIKEMDRSAYDALNQIRDDFYRNPGKDSAELLEQLTALYERLSEKYSKPQAEVQSVSAQNPARLSLLFLVREGMEKKPPVLELRPFPGPH